MANEPKMTWVKPKEPTPQIYSNYIHVSWTLYDLTVQLGQLVPTEPGGVSNAFVVDDRGAVTMAWPAVKNLRDTLIVLVDSYEKTNGEIKPLKLPPSVPALKPSAEDAGREKTLTKRPTSET
jgi:hypothetical protein